MKKIFLLLLICGTYSSVFSQRDFFAFASKEAEETVLGTVDPHKLNTAQRVFDALVNGQGDFRRQKPVLVMNKGKSYVAWAQPEKAEIGLEELAYDICTSFGADSLNALAALLTHELVHYYEKHDWRRHFVKENRDLSTAQQLEKLKEGLKLEAQADYLGGFLAYSVGFDVYGIMPELLKKVYAKEAYDLPEEMDGYPSLQDRIAMSVSSMERLYELQIVFETANYLALLESYPAADRYYHYILKDFQSRDIFNNAGVNTLLAALPLFPKKELPYALPIELDPVSRLTLAGTRTAELENKKQRENYIRTAIDYFDRALILDQQYGPALLNKAVSFVLLEDWEEANYWLKKATQEAHNPKMSADAQVLRGIIAAAQDDLDGAKTWWQKALDAKSYLAELNLKILESGPEPIVVENSKSNFGFVLRKKEKIEDLALDVFLEETAPDQMIKIDDHTVCGFYQRPQSKIYSHSVDFGKEFISVQLVDHTFSGKSMEGIQVGDHREKLLEVYGHPQRQLQSPIGEYLVYEQGRHLFFQLNAAAEVVGWGVYRMSVP